jgi:predicted DNA-binding protein YlxM (UPF0122 family)
MQANETDIRHLLPHGSMQAIAHKLGISRQAVSQAMKAAKPNSPAVQEAIKIVERAGTMGTARILAVIKAS